VALTLRLLGGLTAGEIALAFLVPEATMAKRLTRSKQKIKANRIPYRVPADAELPNRLRGVLATLYLVFNEGYLSSSEETAIRADLCAEAIRLARILASLMPDEPEVQSLLALMLLTDARVPPASPAECSCHCRTRTARYGTTSSSTTATPSSGPACAATVRASTSSSPQSTPCTRMRLPPPRRTGARWCSSMTSCMP